MEDQTNEREPPLDLTTISVLIPKSKNGDLDAREKLLAEIQTYVLQVARQQLNGRLTRKIGSSDIVQLSLVRVIQGFENFCGTSSAELRGWLKAIVTNEVHRMRRSFLTEKRDIQRETALSEFEGNEWVLSPPDRQLTPCSQSIARERVDKFHAILDQLSVEHAEVIRLRNIERFSFREIADRMLRSPEAVSKLWYRAMTKFEEKLRADGNFGSS